jgi:ABC-type Fe3+-siderophore transport system permease subunit
MSEIILVVVAVAVLLVGIFAKNKLKPQQLFPIQLIGFIVVMILVWFLSPESKFGVKLLLTGILLSSVFMNYRAYSKAKS